MKAATTTRPDLHARHTEITAQPSARVPSRAVAGVAATPPALRAATRRSWLVRLEGATRGVFNRLIASYSLVSNDPILDMRDFAWTAMLREHWKAIRDEAMSVALRERSAPSLVTITPDHRSIAPRDKGRSYSLWSHGHPVADKLALCPMTASVVGRVPGLSTATFSILAPGTHIHEHRGLSKGLITCHLGLIVPRDGDVRMRVDDRVVRWAEGETLVFDDTFPHEVWNETAGTRVVLLLRFERPLRAPGKWFAAVFLGMVRRSAFVQERESM